MFRDYSKFLGLGREDMLLLNFKMKTKFRRTKRREKSVYSTRYFYKYKPPMYTVSMVTKTLSSADGMKASNAA